MMDLEPESDAREDFKQTIDDRLRAERKGDEGMLGCLSGLFLAALLIGISMLGKT